MGLLERISAARSSPVAAWPVGTDVGGGLTGPTGALGDDSRFSPAEYGDYLATSSLVYSAASLRARLMSSIEPLLYRGRGPDKVAVNAGPVVSLLRHVNPFWTWPRLARMDELAMSVWGETYWVIERNRVGVPSEIWWAKPSQMTPVPDSNRYLKGFLYQPLSGGEPVSFAPNEVVWFRYPNPINEFAPLAPMAAARLAADTASSMMRSNRNLFAQGLQAGGVIVPEGDKVTFSAEQALELEQMLDRQFKGVDKAHRWRVLRFDAQFRGLNVTPKDAEFVNGLNLTKRDVATAFGIPSPLLNDLEHATLANLREFQKGLWEHALVPDAVFKAAEIEEQLLPMFDRAVGRAGRPDHVEFDFTGVAALQESQSEAWGRERQAIEVGALTINEWRSRRGLPSVEWGDVWHAPVNKAPVGETPTPTPEEETDDEGTMARFAAEIDRMFTEVRQDREVTRELVQVLAQPRTTDIEYDDIGRPVRKLERVNGSR